MKIEEIIQAWKEDTQIDDLNLDKESAKTVSLHAKYASWLSVERSLLRSLQIRRKILLRKLRDYYLGISSREELEEMKREAYQARILKNEVATYIEGDPELITLDAKMSLQEEKVDILIEIMRNINGRNFTFKNMLDHRRLMLGN